MRLNHRLKIEVMILKRFKWIFIFFGMIVISVSGYILYEFKFKTFDLADEKVNQIVDDDYWIQLPEGKEVVITSEGEIIEEKNEKLQIEDDTYLVVKENKIAAIVNDLGKEIDHSTYKVNMMIEKLEDDKVFIVTESGEKIMLTTIENNNKPQTTEVVTVNSIKEKYYDSLYALQGQAESKIGNLINVAKNEYQDKKAKGESISWGYFYNKYVGASNSLEASTDVAFEELMTIIEADFVANGFDRSEAQIFRNEYEKTKEMLRSDLKSKALSIMD